MSAARGDGENAGGDLTLPEDPLDSSTAGARSARGGLLRSLAFGSGTVLSLVGIIFVTRALGPVRFGTFQTVLNLVALVASLTEAGMGAVGIREYAQLNDGALRQRFIQTLLGLRLVLTGVGVAVAIAISVLRGYDMPLVLGTVAAGAGLLAAVAQSTFLIPLYGQLRFAFISVLEVGRSALLAIAYVTLALLAAGEFAFLAATLPVQLLLVIIVLFVDKNPRLAIPRVSTTDWKSLVRANYALAMAAAIGTVYLYATQLVTSFTASPAEIGYFAASLRVYAVAVLIPATIIFGSFPILSRYADRDPLRFASAVRSLSQGALVISVGLALITFVAAPAVMAVVGGEEFAPALSSLRILAPSLAMAGFISVWGVSLVSLRRHRAVVVGNTAALLSSVVLAAVLSSRFGANGAAVATVLGEILLMASFGIALWLREPTLRPGVVALLKVVGAAVVIGGVCAVLPVPSALAAVVAGGAFVVAVLVLRALPPGIEDIVPLPARLVPAIRRASGE